MSINWDKFEETINSAIEDSSKKTDEKLASKISSVTMLTDEDIVSMFPEQSDIKKLTKLMKIVKSAENKNTKINKVVDNVEDFAGIIITLLDKYRI